MVVELERLPYRMKGEKNGGTMGFFSKLFKGSEDPYDKYTYDWLKKSPEEKSWTGRRRLSFSIALVTSGQCTISM